MITINLSLFWASLPGGRRGELVTVCIPARNEEANLARLMPSLLAQDHPDLQIVVVDDASEDGTWEVLRRHADPRLVAVRGNGPPAGWVGKVHALYQAQKRADGDVLVFLTGEMEIEKCCTELRCRALRRRE